MANSNGVNGRGSGHVPGHLPTVHEALPYSPFTSIVPFSPGTLLFTLETPSCFTGLCSTILAPPFCGNIYHNN